MKYKVPQLHEAIQRTELETKQNSPLEVIIEHSDVDTQCSQCAELAQHQNIINFTHSRTCFLQQKPMQKVHCNFTGSIVNPL